METIWKESPIYSTEEKWAAVFTRRRETFEDDGRFGCPKYATADETVKVVHTLVMCETGEA